MSKETENLPSPPHWDLSNVYPGLESEAFVQAVNELQVKLDDLDAYLETHQIGPGVLQLTDEKDAMALAQVIGSDCIGPCRLLFTLL